MSNTRGAMSTFRPGSAREARNAEPQDTAKGTELKKEQEAESRYRNKVRESFTHPRSLRDRATAMGSGHPPARPRTRRLSSWKVTSH